MAANIEKKKKTYSRIKKRTRKIIGGAAMNATAAKDQPPDGIKKAQKRIQELEKKIDELQANIDANKAINKEIQKKRSKTNRWVTSSDVQQRERQNKIYSGQIANFEGQIQNLKGIINSTSNLNDTMERAKERAKEILQKELKRAEENATKTADEEEQARAEKKANDLKKEIAALVAKAGQSSTVPGSDLGSASSPTPVPGSARGSDSDRGSLYSYGDDSLRVPSSDTGSTPALREPSLSCTEACSW